MYANGPRWMRNNRDRAVDKVREMERSAGFQPAVSPISNRQNVVNADGCEKLGPLQAGSTAIQQIGNRLEICATSLCPQPCDSEQLLKLNLPPPCGFVIFVHDSLLKPVFELQTLHMLKMPRVAADEREIVTERRAGDLDIFHIHEAARPLELSL